MGLYIRGVLPSGCGRPFYAFFPDTNPQSPMANSNQPSFAIGVDYGTNSVRALVVDIADGREVATHVYDYPSGEAGVILDPPGPHTARQNPADYIEGFYCSVGCAVQAAAAIAGFSPDRVIGIGIDTTGSTPIPVDRSGRPLAMLPEFAHELAAQAWLWKDHTGHAEAAEVTEKAKQGPRQVSQQVRRGL